MVLLRALSVRAAAVLASLSLLACEADPGTTVTPEPDVTPPMTDNPMTCEPVEAATLTPEVLTACEEVIRPRQRPFEFVGLTWSQMTTREDLRTFLSGLYGQQAQDGRAHDGLELDAGLRLSSVEDPALPGQAFIDLKMESAQRGDDIVKVRTIFKAPASHAYGELFMDVVDTALARANEVYAGDPDDSEPFFLEHRLRSTKGGALDIRVRYADGLTTLELQTHSPRTLLADGKVNDIAYQGKPFESIAGEVNFHLSLDQFEFFATRAYGITAGAAQNFKDFELNPHNWLRLTVEPELDEERVAVGFELVTEDGRRLEVSKAPASLLAGEQFMQNVIRMHRNMDAQMDRDGMAPRFEVPFYYDDPSGGGVVQVIARGQNGEFSIAYGVETPVNFLTDSELPVRYSGKVEIPDNLEPVEVTCEELGSTQALEGSFAITFSASDPVKDSTKLDGPLRGNVWGSVFKAEDVSGLGPKPGAESVASFAFEGVDLLADTPVVYDVEGTLPNGRYQILGFIDIDQNADLEDPDPDTGDPVTLPIGAYELECARQPVNVEFAVLRP